MATAQQPLLPVRFPRFDTHITVTLAFRNATDSGLPVGGSLEALRALEDELSRIVGEDGDLLAHESSRGTRTMHFCGRRHGSGCPHPRMRHDVAGGQRAREDVV